MNNPLTIELLQSLTDYDEKHNHCIDFENLLKSGKSFFTVINPITRKIDKIVSFLLDHNADPNKPDKFGIYPLQYAIEMKSYSYTKSLINSNKIDYSVKLNKSLIGKSLNNETYLHVAAECSNIKILQIFLDKNLIDITSTDDLGETPFTKAIKINNIPNANMIEKSFKFINIDNLSDNEEEDDENSNDLHFITSLLNQLEESTKNSGDPNNDIKKVANHNSINERKKLIKDIQDLFNKTKLFDRPFTEDFNEDDDDYENGINLTDLNFKYQQLYEELAAGQSDQKILNEISILFNQIKKIDYKNLNF